MHQELAPDPLLILINNQNNHCMQETVLKIRYFERGLSKSLQRVSLAFFSKPIPFNRQNYQKQKELGTSD